MYRSNNIEKRNLTKKLFGKYDLHRICKVDQFNSQSFNKSEFGWSRNSISAMAKAVNYSEFLALASQIAKTPAKFNLPEKCSLKDALALCRPRMAQSPAELDMFAKQLADNDLDKLNEQYLKNLNTTQRVKAEQPAPVETPVES